MSIINIKDHSVIDKNKDEFKTTFAKCHYELSLKNYKESLMDGKVSISNLIYKSVIPSLLSNTESIELLKELINRVNSSLTTLIKSSEILLELINNSDEDLVNKLNKIQDDVNKIKREIGKLGCDSKYDPYKKLISSCIKLSRESPIEFKDRLEEVLESDKLFSKCDEKINLLHDDLFKNNPNRMKTHLKIYVIFRIIDGNHNRLSKLLRR